METCEIFAKRIRALREKRGIGVRQLAAELEISHSSISLYENEKKSLRLVCVNCLLIILALHAITS